MTGDFDDFDNLDQLDTFDHVGSRDADPQMGGVADGAEPAVDVVDVEGADFEETPVTVDTMLAPTTGHARVDAATAVLDGLDNLPTADHAELFEDVHRRLQGALADLDGD